MWRVTINKLSLWRIWDHVFFYLYRKGIIRIWSEVLTTVRGHNLVFWFRSNTLPPYSSYKLDHTSTSLLSSNILWFSQFLPKLIYLVLHRCYYKGFYGKLSAVPYVIILCLRIRDVKIIHQTLYTLSLFSRVNA